MTITTATEHPDKTLYERLGGAAAVDAAVLEFYRRVFADAELAEYFVGIDRVRLIDHQRSFLTAALGGPVHQRHRSLADAHRPIPDHDAGHARAARSDHLPRAPSECWVGGRRSSSTRMD